MQKRALVIWSSVKAAIAVSLVGWGALHLRGWDAYVGVRLPSWSRAPGRALMIAGGLLVLVCGGVLSTLGFLTPEDRFFPKQFTASGPFRYVRNPMSLGWVILMLGLGLHESSVLVVAFSAALFLFVHVVIVFVEEPGLEKRFGESYREYKRSVHRWVPKFGGNGVK
jgi:protein-S-isoprenylcysteine O-methyltransferase Ste14